MSGFTDVRRSSCRIVRDDGGTAGTGFFVLPGGYLITCHHVIFGLETLRVAVWGDPSPRTAEYVAELSDPTADVAVLVVSGPPACVQLGAVRERAAAFGFGFRPSERDAEPSGHSFSGRLGPGQELRIAPEAGLVERLQGLTAQRAPWNILPEAFRVGHVVNFDQVVGLERGISGGPVYDPALRRVVGLFRAVEGDALGYVVPIENALARWPDLLKRNATEVADEPLDRLGREFRVGLVAEGADPVIPRARRYFAEFFKNAQLVGGRTRELFRLDCFLEDGDDGYFFVTGPAGFGKTALLSRWLEELEGRGVDAAFHFISRDETAVGVLQSLCEQLLALHGLGGEVPEHERDLRLLYADLLQLAPPASQGVPVIIDGLDEALGRWHLRPDLFPQNLGAGLKVVFSAREIANRDWPASVGLSLGADYVMGLGRLDRSEIADTLVRAGIVEDGRTEYAASAIAELSGGDPFYVHDLILEFAGAGGDLNALEGLPRTHSEYLRRWWKAGFKDCGEEPFSDLMGSLAVARGPLLRDELVGLSPEDSLRGANIDLLLEQAARYLSGDEWGGYSLSHRRIYDFVEALLSDEIGTYRRRLGEYCLKEAAADAPAQYVLLHGAAHVAELAGLEAVVALLDAHWINVKWMRFGSYIAVAEDFGIALDAALAREPLDGGLAMSLAVARQTAREMTNFPVSLLVAWARLGHIQLVAAIARALPDQRGHAVEGLVAVAGELLRSGRSAHESSEPVELLSRAIELLPLLRMSFLQRRSLEAILSLLEAQDGLPHDTAVELVRRTADSVARFRDPVSRAVGFGAVIETWVALRGSEEELNRFVDEGIAATETVDYPAERIIATAPLLPALRTSEPDRAEELLRTMIAEEAFLGTATAHGTAAEALAAALRCGAAATPTDAITAVLRIAEVSLAAGSLNAAALSATAVALVELGDEKAAAELFNRVTAREGNSVVEASIGLAIMEHLGPDDPREPSWAARARDAIDRVPANVFPSKFIPRIVKTGDLEFAQTLLQRHSGAAQQVDDCLIALEEARTAKPEAVEQFVEQLEALRHANGGAASFAAAARALLAHGLSKGVDYADRATAACSSELPPGNTDVLRVLLAAALHQEGAHNEAVEVVSQMASAEASKRTYKWLVEAACADSPAIVEPYARALGLDPASLFAPVGSAAEVEENPADVPTWVDALIARLERDIGDLKKAICADATHSPELLEFMKVVSESRGDPVRIRFTEVARAGPLARDAVRLTAHAPDSAATLLEQLVDVLLGLPSEGDVASALGAVVERLSNAGPGCRAYFQPLLERVLNHTPKFKDPKLGEYVTRKALDALVAVGDFEWAREIVAGFASSELAQFTEWRIATAAASAQLDFFERTVVHALGDAGAAWLTYSRSVDSKEGVAELVRDFAKTSNRTRQEMLDNEVPLLAVLVQRVAGLGGLMALVEALEEIDRRFLDAAALVASPAAAPVADPGYC